MSTSSSLPDPASFGQEVDRRRIHLLFQRASAALATVLVNSLVLAYFLSSVVPVERLAVWVAALYTITGLRGLLLAAYHHDAAQVSDLTWESWFALGAALNGLAWGLGLATFAQLEVTYAVVALFVGGGMVAGASVSASSSMRTFVAFTLPASVPVIAALVLVGDPAHTVMGLTSALYCMAMAKMAHQGTGVVRKITRLRLQNAQMGEELERRPQDRAWRLQSLLDHSGVITIVTDPVTSQILDASQNVRQMLALPQQQALNHCVIGSDLLGWQMTETEWQEMVRYARAGDYARIVTRGGSHHTQVTATMRQFAGHDYVLIVMKDVSQQRRTLTRGMAHEINNPLTYVLGGLREISSLLDGVDSPLAEALRRPTAEALHGAENIRSVMTELGATPSQGSVSTLDVEGTPASTSRLKVLVIDDDERVARSIARALERHDVRVETDPLQAIATLTRDATFDAVLCDVMMPTMSGIRVFVALQDQAPAHAARVVFITGGVFSEGVEAFLERIPNVCLAKPITEEDLEAAVQVAAQATPLLGQGPGQERQP